MRSLNIVVDKLLAPGELMTTEKAWQLLWKEQERSQKIARIVYDKIIREGGQLIPQNN